MITVAPATTFEAWAQFATGSTVGVRIRDGAGADFLARTTSGVTEDVAGSGLYRKPDFTAPSAAGQYELVWDDGTNYAAEELLVTYSVTAIAPSSNEYVTVAELKATLTLTGQTYADADITLAVYAASRAIDNYCRRRFYADTDATQVRYYRGLTDTPILRIDDLVTLTSVQTDPGGDGTYEETWTLNTDFTLEPDNATADGKPTTLIRMHESGRYSFSSSYPRTVKVTGKFGWPSVPHEVKAATSILATQLLKRAREAPFGVVALGVDTAARITRTDPHLKLLLDPYVKWRL